MTSTTDTAGHPEVEEISDLTEGLLPPSRTADVRRHLDDCTLCADVYDSLEEIRGLLGTLPAPSRMPDDVAGRIDAALAAEAVLDSTAPALDSGVAAPMESATAHVSRETSSATPADRPSGRPRAATGPGRTNVRRRGRRRIALGAVFTAAALGLGTLWVQTLNDDTGKTSGPSALHTDAAHTYSDGKLGSQVADLLSTKKAGGRTGSGKPSMGIESDSTGSTGTQPNNTFGTATVKVPTCIERAIPDDHVLLAADKGVYEGVGVYLLVTPDSSDSTRVAAYVVDAACTKQGSASPGKVLLKRSYARS
ncbi:anti-sigma factor family protein [Streptomyces avermitilis]|uniref:anti-sigma factor family protein n=1 Tax=Streptomyces avermitilis TaxID=33903 RepID=UPI0038280E76